MNKKLIFKGGVAIVAAVVVGTTLIKVGTALREKPEEEPKEEKEFDPIDYKNVGTCEFREEFVILRDKNGNWYI